MRRLTQMTPPQIDRVSQSPCLHDFHQNLTPCPAGCFKVIPQSYHEQDWGQRIQPAGGKVLATLILTVLVWLLHWSPIYYHFFSSLSLLLREDVPVTHCKVTFSTTAPLCFLKEISNTIGKFMMIAAVLYSYKQNT